MCTALHWIPGVSVYEKKFRGKGDHLDGNLQVRGIVMVRPLVQHLYDCLKAGVWPDGPTAITDFGIDSPAHYEALANAVVSGDITLQDLDAALGNGPLITRLTRKAGSNSNKEIVFRTPWDEMRKRSGSEGN